VNEKLEKAREILESAIETYQPKHIFSLLSGGHDSMTVTHFSASVLGDRLDAVVHINTGIGIEQTREYVRERCKDFGWKLLEYKATENTKADGTPDPKIYEEWVLKHGFPGPHGHRMMYVNLKQRQIDRLCRDVGATTSEPVMFVSGVRKEESTRRMGNVKVVDVQGRSVWVSPFIEMTGIECSEYMDSHQIPRNEVKDLIHMSGECLCGAFAHPGELKEIELWFPETAAYIRDLEKKARAAGFPWGWEEQPPQWWSDRKKAEKHGQQDAFEEEALAEIQYLCVGCGKREETKKAPPK
jgi:3'-phosphoadenosine 5'-phosphosulfate sulfotransferase (PAPS reductase)/FAD synthetase